MICNVAGCRFKNTHYTFAHKCGSCHLYGHGQQECSTGKRVIYNEESKESKESKERCTNINCKIPETHVIDAHQKDFEKDILKIQLFNDMGHLNYNSKNKTINDMTYLYDNIFKKNVEPYEEIHNGYGYQFYRYKNERELHLFNNKLYDIDYKYAGEQIK